MRTIHWRSISGGGGGGIGRRGCGDGVAVASVHSVVQIEGGEGLGEPPAAAGGVDHIEAEAEIDASAELVEVLVCDAPARAAPPAALEVLPPEPRLVALAVRRPGALLEEAQPGLGTGHGGQGLGSPSSLALAAPVFGEGGRRSGTGRGLLFQVRERKRR